MCSRARPAEHPPPRSTSRFARKRPGARRGARDRAAAAGPLPPRGRPRRARAARRALPSTGTRPGAALLVHRRVGRRPVPGRQPRPRQGDRSLRARAGQQVHELCRAHDPGRAQAPLPRQGLGAAPAARAAGAHARRQPHDRAAVEAAGPVAEGPRGRERARTQRRGGARGAGGRCELRGGVAGRADGARRRRGGRAGRPDRHRRHVLRAGREPGGDRESPGRHCRTSSGACSSCASCTT